MTEEAILATKLAKWRISSSTSRTSVTDGPAASASFSSVTTVVSNPNLASAASSSQTPRGLKRKTLEEYKIVPDPAFPLFKELRKLATRESKVKNHLKFITECLDQSNIPKGLTIRIKPAFGADQPEFMANWNSACTDFSRNLMLMLGERANSELEALRPQVESKTEEMNKILKEKTEIDKVSNYLKTVIEKDMPENKKARRDIPRQIAKKPRYNTFKRKDKQRKQTSESEEDILRLIRSIKQRRRR